MYITENFFSKFDIYVKLRVAFEFPILCFVYFCVGILFLALDEHVKTDEVFEMRLDCFCA